MPRIDSVRHAAHIDAPTLQHDESQLKDADAAATGSMGGERQQWSGHDKIAYPTTSRHKHSPSMETAWL